MLIALSNCNQNNQAKSEQHLTQHQSSLVEKENELNKIYKNILDISRSGNEIDWDKLEAENENFETFFKKTISGNPSSLTYSFDSLKSSNIHIVTSDDNQLRIYSWDTWLGGTMHDFKNIFQFKSNDQIHTTLVKSNVEIVEEAYVPFYSDIFTLKTASQTYYLAVNNGIYTSKDLSQSIIAFHINYDKLEKANIFKTENGLTNSIDINFNFLSVADRPERPLQLINYDNEKKIISLPIVDEDENVTDVFFQYMFNGEVFEIVK